MILNDTLTISSFSKIGRRKNFKLLYDIIFDFSFNRTNRVSLRNFAHITSGSILSEKKKKVFIKISHYLAVCILFNLGTSGSKEQLIKQSFAFLLDFNMLLKVKLLSFTVRMKSLYKPVTLTMQLVPVKQLCLFLGMKIILKIL